MSTIPRPGSTDALFLPQTREKFRALTNLGLTDAIRAVSDERGLYTFWDYQAGAWQKNNGIRIDHLLLSPQAADRLTTAGIDKHVRAWEKPSDHVPVYVDLDIEPRSRRESSRRDAGAYSRRPSTQRLSRISASARSSSLACFTAVSRSSAIQGSLAPGPSQATVSHIRPDARWRMPCSPLNRMRPSTACDL